MVRQRCVVDMFLQKLEMEAFFSDWQIEYGTELQRVQVALYIWSNEPGNTDAKLQRSSSSNFQVILDVNINTIYFFIFCATPRINMRPVACSAVSGIDIRKSQIY